jgi:hypothetical protein
MKINFIPTIIAIAISGLISYGFYSFHNSNNKLLLSSGSFAFLALTLIFTIAVNFDLPRTKINIRTVSSLFFVVSLVSNLTFSSREFTKPIYVIINGILLLTYIFTIYSIHKSKQ